MQGGNKTADPYNKHPRFRLAFDIYKPSALKQKTPSFNAKSLMDNAG